MSKWTRYAIVSDVHGDMQDQQAVRAFHAFCNDYRPQKRILAGDLWDFRPLRKKADEHERAQTLQDDYKEGCEFFRAFAPQVFTLGNHDHRIYRIAETANGIVADFAGAVVEQIEGMAERAKCEILPYDKRRGVYSLGKLNVMHGFFAGKFAAKQHAEHYGLCAFGHTHCVTEYNIPKYPHGQTAWNIGCLCNLDMEYDAARPGSMAQRHGWAYGVVNERTGDFVIHLAREIGGRYVCSTEINWY